MGISAFAAMLGVTYKTFEAWEKGIRKPSATAHNFLLVIKKHPNLVKKAIFDTVKIEKAR